MRVIKSTDLKQQRVDKEEAGLLKDKVKNIEQYLEGKDKTFKAKKQ